jgi:hypothetical protein
MSMNKRKYGTGNANEVQNRHQTIGELLHYMRQDSENSKETETNKTDFLLSSNYNSFHWDVTL